MAQTGYHLIDPAALPGSFWQTTGEDQETITRLQTLERSLWRSGVCWLVWSKDKSALYEQRDLYQCAVVRTVEHDVIRGKATPCGDLCRRESIPIFFSVAQFWKILSGNCESLTPVNAHIQPMEGAIK